MGRRGAVGRGKGGNVQGHTTLVGSDELVLHAADWQHQAAQGELPCHGGVTPHRVATEEADERNCQRDPCAGAILRDCARRQVHCSS